MRSLIARIADLRRQAYQSNREPGVMAALERAEEEARIANDEYGRLVDQITRESGIPEELLVQLERASIPSDPVNRRPRAAVTIDALAPTGWLEGEVQKALELLVPKLDHSWLDAQGKRGYRLEPDFLNEPLAFIRGVRMKSERRAVHRFAQHVLVARDFLNQEATYDWFAGALMVPQTAALGMKFRSLSEVSGDVGDRISALWRLPSDQTDSTIYELLVAASCAEAGRRAEFLRAGQVKTPDLRIHDYPFPLVVECKRKRQLTDVDVADNRVFDTLYRLLRPACLSRGMTGVVTLRLTVASETLPLADVTEAATRQRLVPNPHHAIQYEWGAISWIPKPRRIPVPPTRLYSPLFLNVVFGWEMDLPVHDGIICQVRSPRSVLVDEARDPLALVWSNENSTVIVRNARAATALFASGIRQIPPGEVGLVYVCFQESDRESVADDRTEFLQRQLHNWTHEWQIRVPATVMTRIIPRPLGHGAPDLVETGLQFYSAVTGSPKWFGDFPSKVFTP